MRRSDNVAEPCRSSVSRKIFWMRVSGPQTLECHLKNQYKVAVGNLKCSLIKIQTNIEKLPQALTCIKY